MGTDTQWLKKSGFYFLLLFFSQVSFAQDSTETAGENAQKLYQDGILHYQKSQWPEASESLEKALMQDPSNPYILYNLGLAAHQQEKLGLAMGYWRKAVSLMPSLQPAKQAIEFAMNENGLVSTQTNLGFGENLRRSVLIHLRPRSFFLVTGLALFATGWTWILYIGRRQRALNEQTPLPPPPYLPMALSLLLALFAALSIAKALDELSPRGTIVTGDVRAKSGPSEDSSDLFELMEATEVILKARQGEWLQVSYPGGLSGWIPTDQVFQTSGEIR